MYGAEEGNYTGTRRLLAGTCRRAEGQGLTRGHVLQRSEQGMALLARRREVAPHSAKAPRPVRGPEAA